MTTARRFDPRRLDVRVFAAEGASLAGDWRLAALDRLVSAGLREAVDAAAEVPWNAQGSRRTLLNVGAQASLAIAADAVLAMQCQRCLQAVQVPLSVERTVFFVEGEDAAAALDAESEDDVLALSPSMDLQALIEEELLLALPLIPRHEICPEPLLAASHEAPEQPQAHPFAALAALKRGGLPS